MFGELSKRRETGRTSTLGLCLAALLGLGLSSTVAGCGGEPVGRKCFIGLDAGASQSIIASPALECPSRTCLHVPLQRELPTFPEDPDRVSEYADLCTAECTEDKDCERVPESPCQLGFTCAIPVVVGPFCCRKMCICKDYLLIPDGGVPTPEACKPGVAGNTCCNLAGNETLPQCQ